MELRWVFSHVTFPPHIRAGPQRHQKQSDQGRKHFQTRPCTTVRDSEDILEQLLFQKYTCWVFLALCDMLYLCICAFVFMHLYLCICAFDTWEYDFLYP